MSEWDSAMLREFAEATHAKKAHDAASKKAKAKIDELDPQIRDMFTEQGVPSAQIVTEARDVDKEAYQIIGDIIDREVSSEFVSALAEDAVKALREAGLLVDSTQRKTTTLFIGSRVWAKPVPTGVDDKGDSKVTDEDRLRACAALEAHGFGQYVRPDFNIVSLSSAIKEDVVSGAIKTGAEFFDGAVEVEEKFQVQTRVKNG